MTQIDQSDESDVFAAQMERIAANEAHDLAVIKAEIRRKGAPLAVAFAFLLALMVYAAFTHQPYLDSLSAVSSGFIAGGAAYLSPSLVMKDKILKYYELKREEAVRAEEACGDESGQ